MAADMLGATLVEETAVEYNRQCRIELGPSREERLVLSWNVGAPTGRTTVFVLDPKDARKQKCVVPLERAQAWFGFFTVPTLINDVADPKKREMMNQTYREERERALNTWGDYPRPHRLSDGVQPVAPHRFPDVIVTVIEQDGTEWEPIRLHELYQIGDFDTLQFTDPIAERDAELQDERALRSQLEKELAEMRGQMKALIATVNGGVRK